MPHVVSCPNCGKPVSWTDDSRHRPFCSDRCRLIDLGEWFDEERRIPSDEVDPPVQDDPEPGAW